MLNKFLEKKSQYLLLFFYLFIILFSPYYVFDSGLPQPTHIIVLIISIILISINYDQFIKITSQNILGVLFLLYIFIVNISFAFLYQDGSFIISTLHWVYGYILLITILCTKHEVWIFLWLKLFIAVGLFFIVAAYFLGYGGYDFWPRYQFFFNGPNQLGFYVLCLGIIYLSLSKSKIDVKFFIVYALIFFSAMTTLGRSVYIGLLPLAFLFIWQSRSNIKNIIALLIISFSIIIIIFYSNLPICDKPLKDNNLNKFTTCLHKYDPKNNAINNYFIERLSPPDSSGYSKNYSGILYQLEVRGYFRFLEYPRYLLFGAGQGLDTRFDSEFGYEIHSTIGSVIFYYGFVGTFLFAVFIWKIVSNKHNFIYFAPLFFYGLFTQGIRSPYFWITLSFLAFSEHIPSASLRIKSIANGNINK